jgi:hypothetical protein
VGSPARRPCLRRRRAGCCRSRYAGRDARGRSAHGFGVRGCGRRAGSVRTRVASVSRAARSTDRRGRCRRRHPRVVEGLGGAVQLRGRVAGSRRPVTHHPESAHLRSHRRHRRRRHDLPPRTAGRGPELGLPLLLAPGRDVHALRPHDGGLSGRGAGVARLAAAGRRRVAVRHADHVWMRRRAPPPGASPRLAPGLRGGAAGADRERGRAPVPARRVRRGDGLPASGAAHRHPTRPVLVGAAAFADGVPGVTLDGGRRGHLGGAGPTSPLHPLQGDGVGRCRFAR